MTEYSITFPLPPKKLGPNARGVGKHWAVKSRATASYREVCGYLAKEAWGRREPIAGRVTIDLDFYTYKDRRQLIDDGLYRPRDEQNAISSAKAACDALIDAGVIKGDSKKHVKIGEVRLHTTQKEHGGRTELILKLMSENGAGEIKE